MYEIVGGKTTSIIVYHGGTDRIEYPLFDAGRAHLDFGLGFYVADMLLQATEWAKKVADLRRAHPVINKYELNRDAILSECRCKVFADYDGEWLDFIVASRQGQKPWAQFDYIEGGVADDRVIDTINLYMAGLMTREVALVRLSEHRPNNQMCLLSQQLIDKYLIFNGAESV